MTTNNGSPSDSTASGILVETVDEDSGGDAGTVEDEQLSEASSVGSVVLGADDVSPGDMTDLTGPTLCRVYMTRTEGGQRIYCCCGNQRTTCARRGHQAKDSHHRAPARWYEAFPNPQGRYRGISDGRMDRIRTGLTSEEMTAWRASEAEEIARVASAFTDEEEEMTEDGNGSMTLESRMVQDGASTPLRRLVDDLEGTMDEALEGVRRVTFGPDQYATTPVTNNLTIEDDVNTAWPRDDVLGGVCNEVRRTTR